MQLKDFKIFDFKDNFQINENFDITTGEYQDLKYITIDNFFKYPDKVFNILKNIPINDRSKVIDLMKENGVDVYETASAVQYISNVALESVSYMFYKILSDEDFIYHSYDPSTESEELGKELCQFVYFSNIFYPGLKHISNNYMPHFDKFQYVCSTCLSPTAEDTGISFYTLENDGESYQSIESIMKIDSIDTRCDIRDKLNNMHDPSFSTSEYYSHKQVENNTLFKKYFTIPCEFNKVIIYPGIFWHASDYDAETKEDVRYTFNCGYTPTDNIS